MQTNNKQREALEAIWKEANTQYRNDNGIDLEWLMAKAKSALAEPVRNCEVGTAEEQAQRFREWCKKHDCPNCQFAKSPSAGNCALGWAQMPYEEGGAK